MLTLTYCASAQTYLTIEHPQAGKLKLPLPKKGKEVPFKEFTSFLSDFTTEYILEKDKTPEAFSVDNQVYGYISIINEVADLEKLKTTKEAAEFSYTEGNTNTILRSDLIVKEENYVWIFSTQPQKGPYAGAVSTVISVVDKSGQYDYNIIMRYPEKHRKKGKKVAQYIVDHLG